jgi:hypothetical protein
MDIDLITEASGLWAKRRQGLLSPDEHEIALFALETRYGLDVVPCGSCGIRHASRFEDGASLCYHCREVGDLIDRAWDQYRDHREQIGGQLG